MKKILIILNIMFLVASCDIDSFLDVNQPKSAPTDAPAEQRMLAMQDWCIYGTMLDNVILARYCQYWVSTATTVATYIYDELQPTQYYSATSYGGVNMWRTVYWNLGMNANDAIDDATSRGGYHMAGAVQVMYAWAWMMTTDRHGDMPYKEAFTNTITPNYDKQKEIYIYTDTLLNRALANFSKINNDAVCPLSKGDKWYNGDVAKWKKLAYAMKARLYNHLTKKSEYNPAKVIEYVDKSFESNNDVPVAYTITSDLTKTGYLGYYSKERTNLTNLTETSYIVSLLDSTLLGKFDPRLPKMFNANTAGKYVGVNPPQGTLGGNPSGLVTADLYGKWWSKIDSKLAIIYYPELQFIKAEAAFIKGDKSTAYSAFKKAIQADMDRNGVRADSATAYLTSKAVPVDETSLTLSDIMTQKYIAMMLSPDECFTDLRRYDFKPNVFKGLHKPGTIVDAMKNNWPRRVCYRYHSEFQYNWQRLIEIGELTSDKSIRYSYIWKKVWWDRPSTESKADASDKEYPNDDAQKNDISTITY